MPPRNLTVRQTADCHYMPPQPPWWRSFMKLDALGSLIRWFCRKAVSHVLNHKWYLILKLHFLLSAKRPRLKKENTAKKIFWLAWRSKEERKYFWTIVNTLRLHGTFRAWKYCIMKSWIKILTFWVNKILNETNSRGSFPLKVDASRPLFFRPTARCVCLFLLFF